MRLFFHWLQVRKQARLEGIKTWFYRPECMPRIQCGEAGEWHGEEGEWPQGWKRVGVAVGSEREFSWVITFHRRRSERPGPLSEQKLCVLKKCKG